MKMEKAAISIFYVKVLFAELQIQCNAPFYITQSLTFTLCGALAD